MADSSRSAQIAKDNDIDVGLHLNFSEAFSSPSTPGDVRKAHDRIEAFLCLSKYAQLLYNPLLRRPFELVVSAQMEEFARLYSRIPSHIDGHLHLHLCSNLLFQRPVPDGHKVRRSFSFARGEKGALNRAYRAWIDRRQARHYRTTDYFFSLSSCLAQSSLARVLSLARSHSVELMTHPRIEAEYSFLMSVDFADCLKEVDLRDHTSPTPPTGQQPQSRALGSTY
jgi:predicted glycoside hydrolase/deacetylase ChbG (UPF0249 family)